MRNNNNPKNNHYLTLVPYKATPAGGILNIKRLNVIRPQCTW